MLAVGNLLGGWLIRRFDLNVRRTMFVVVVGISMTIVSVTALLLFKCNASSRSGYLVGEAKYVPLQIARYLAFDLNFRPICRVSSHFALVAKTRPAISKVLSPPTNGYM